MEQARTDEARIGRHFSEPLQKFLTVQMEGAPSQEECMRCEASGGIPHHCCKTPGFAVYENIRLIHKEYIRDLWKAIPFAIKNIDIEQFIQLYFTEVVLISAIQKKNVLLKLYFPKIIDYRTLTNGMTGKVHSAGPRIMPDADLDLIVRLPEDFDRFNAKRNHENPTNQGCVFLQRGRDFSIQNCRGCLLHSDNLASHVTTKPIDCISFNCKQKDNAEEKEKRLALYFSELLLQFGTFE
jgi:hypothetical protein